VIQHGGFQVAIVLIASRLVRRIVGLVKDGQEVACGDRIGVIRLGSQVDVVLPVEMVTDVRVDVGDRVKAGETIVALIRPDTTPSHRIDGSASAVGDHVHR
jgi:phosphatidylserine decarboxylase